MKSTPSHENWHDERQREPRTIADALRADNEIKSADDEARKDEQQLDDSRGLWGPTE
jgi:hypothetical protein